MEVSDRAAELIAHKTRLAGKPDGGLRIHRERDQSPNSLKIRYVASPMPDDTVIEHGDARVFVATSAREAVGSFVLDTHEGTDGPRLILR
jgi:iron-sulfur cluster assembly protein